MEKREASSVWKFSDNEYKIHITNEKLKDDVLNKFELRRLERSVKDFEPHIALEAGVDGFREIKKLIIKSNKLLKKNGKLIFEIGADQKINTEKMLNKYGFYINKVIKDLASIPRIIVSTKLK